jgi:hypothetical protein
MFKAAGAELHSAHISQGFTIRDGRKIFFSMFYHLWICDFFEKYYADSFHGAEYK